MALRSTNPYFGKIAREQVGEVIGENYKVSTYLGISLKTLLLIGVLLVTGFASIFLFRIQNNNVMFTLLGVAPVLAFVCALVGLLNVRIVPVMSILYTMFQGLFLGILTWVVEAFLMQGAGLIAISATAIVFLVTFALYSFKVIRVTNVFIKFASIFGISILALFGLSFLFQVIAPEAYINIIDNVWIMLAIGAVFIIYGAICLIMDFERCKQLVESGTDKRYEWQAAFGLIISIIWIYVQIIRLIIVFGGRNN